MAFLDKVSDFGKTVAKKSGEAVDTAKIKIKISDRKGNIKDIKVQMGTAIYETFEANGELDLEALKDAAQVPTVLQEMGVTTAVKNYGESSIEYVLQVWSTAADYWTTTFDVNRNIKVAFDAKGVEMTYPHLNVHLEK